MQIPTQARPREIAPKTSSSVRRLHGPALDSRIKIVLTELRFALRRLRGDIPSALTAILMVAFGAGLSIAVFAAAWGVLARPLPYDHAARLAVVEASSRRDQVADWRARLTGFERLAAYARERVVVQGIGDAQHVPVAYVDESFFATLSLRPIAGQVLQPGQVDATVVSARLATRAGEDPSMLIGRRVSAGGAALTIAGVLPEAFAFPGADVDLWIPWAQARPIPVDRFADVRRFRLVGLLRDGVPLADVAAQAERAHEALQPGDAARGRSARMVDLLTERTTRGVRPALVLFGTAAAFVLLITCASLAAILIGRAVARGRELAVCRALGASPARVLGSVMTEGLLMTLPGTAAAVWIAAAALRALEASAGGSIPRPDALRIDAAVLAFAAGLGVVLAALPTLWAIPSVRRRGAALTVAHSGLTRRDRRTAGGLLALQLALVVMLLAGSVLLLRTAWGLMQTDVGLHSRQALVAPIILTPASAFQPPARWPVVRDLVERVRALPGVTAAGAGSSLPPATAQMEITISLSQDGRETMRRFSTAAVTPGYLEAIGARLVQGRFFSDADLELERPVVILSAAAARAVLPGVEAAGRDLPFHLPGLPRERGIPIVAGVVADVRYAGLEADPEPAIYVRWPDAPMGQGFLAFTTAGDRQAAIAAVRSVMRDVDPALPHQQVRTVDEIIAGTIADRRLAARLGAIIAVLTFSATLVGLSGSVVRAVEERRRELAIRGALGASPRRIVRLVVTEVGRAGAAGVVLGLAGAIATEGLLRSRVQGAGAYDLPTLGGVALFVVCCAGIACYLPARRASQIDPASALRDS
jgi:putative ABC transport system permease protein